MKAIDTNVLARFFVNDPDDSQAVRQRPAAVAAMSGRVFVPVTVLLEFEWVMRGFYGLPRRDTVNVLRALVGIEHVTVEDRAAVLAAVDAFEAGLDFADSLHLMRGARCSALVTFDRLLAKRAKALAQQPVIELLT
jgi:predicted nucleic-acid-binding protein